MAKVAVLDCRGLIVTARGDTCDFVSRFFAPQMGIPEDPVTGSAHCSLVPYWAERLGKTKLHARQISPRGGEIFCEHRGERVQIAGRAAHYMSGIISCNGPSVTGLFPYLAFWLLLPAIGKYHGRSAEDPCAGKKGEIMSNLYPTSLAEALPDKERVAEAKTRLEEAGVKYFLSCWIDILGLPKTKASAHI